MKMLSNKQKTVVSPLSDLSRPTKLKEEKRGCPLTLHKQDTKFETPLPLSPSILITVIESIEQLNNTL